MLKRQKGIRAMDKKTFKYDFTFDKGKKEYKFQMKKKSRLWLWILMALLFLLLCCVRCEHDITVKTVDYETGEPLSDVEITISHTDYFIYSSGRFFGSEYTELKSKTDVDGNAVFEDMPCSIFSYIFCCFSKAEYTAENSCYHLDPSPETSLFHFTWNKTLKMQPNTSDLIWHVVDKETNEPLAGASVAYEFTLSGKAKADSVKTDAAGRCTLAGVPSCGMVSITMVSCYGYEDGNSSDISVHDMVANPDSAKTALVPLKESFTFFVKNKYTKQPVPGAVVDVTVKSASGKSIRGQAQTNVDGQGRGVYQDAPTISEIFLKASKLHYKDGEWTPKNPQDRIVERFVKLNENERTIFLEPEPYMEEFQNVDSITGNPIVGAENIIEITSNGTKSTGSEISNRNGVFYVNAREGDAISITSSHDFYETKEISIASFEKGEIIRMYPKQVNIVFRTVDAEDGSLLDDCTLEIKTTRSNVTDPHNSGNGEFTVQGLYVDETISIIASKFDYGTNAIKIHEAKVSDLMNAPQSDRDIPLALDLEPCNASKQGASGVNAGSVSAPQSYNMGQKQGSFDFAWSNGGSCPDKIDIYNHNPGERYDQSSPIFTTGMTAGDGSAVVSFNKGSVITIVVTTGPQDGSSWDYNISCPK